MLVLMVTYYQIQESPNSVLGDITLFIVYLRNFILINESLLEL